MEQKAKRSATMEVWTLLQGQEQRRGSWKSASLTMIVFLLLGLVASCSLWGAEAAGTGAAAGGRDGDDVACLREFKESVTDPLGYLKNWDFRGRDINICNFIGVTCVRPDEPKVIALDLAAAGLGGRISPGLFRKCSSLKELNLSNNFFTGRIPPTICVHNRNLVNLDLSNNGFSGSFPPNLQKCLESNRRFRYNPLSEESSPSFIKMSSDEASKEDAPQ
jgi:hypothetical protein